MLSNSAFAGLLAAASYALYVLRQIVIAEPSPMGWISPAVAAGRLPNFSRILDPAVSPRSLDDVARSVLAEEQPGLPVARDMDGFARTDLFTPAFNEQRTITFIPTSGVQ